MKAGTRLPSLDERRRIAIDSMVNGTIGGHSKIGMPVEQLIRIPVPPEDSDPFAIELVTGTDTLFADAFSLAAVYSTGMVNTYRNGVGGNSGAKPIDNSAFTQFTLASSSTATTRFYGNNFALDWPYIYVRRNASIAKVDLTTGTAATAVTTATTMVEEVDVRSDNAQGVYVTAGDIYKWTRASETVASGTLVVATAYDYGHVKLDADGNVWAAGASGRLDCYDLSGTLQVGVTVTGGMYVGGLAAHPTDGVIVLTENAASTATLWYHVSPDGTITDVTDTVTVDGTAWTAIPGLADSAWGNPYIHLTSYGNRIGWGGNHSYGSGMSTSLAYHGTITGTP